MLQKYYNKIEEISNNNIIKCEKHYKNKPYQIYYFDISNNWLNINFDLRKYQRLLLTKDYYSNFDFLQWNYYLVFVYDPSDKIDNIEIKEIIKSKSKDIIDAEKDEEFARKFVVNYEKLDDWLSERYNIKPFECNEVSQDLSAIWIKELKNNNLGCVYSRDMSINEGLTNYIKGNYLKEPYEEALNFYLRALKIMENNLNSNDSEIFEVLEQISRLYGKLGKYEEAEIYHNALLETKNKYR